LTFGIGRLLKQSRRPPPRRARRRRVQILRQFLTGIARRCR
jgi:hypothetical protein